MNNKYLVTQSNKLIHSHYDLNLSELKIILTLISLVQPTDGDFEPYKFKIAEFMNLLGIDTKTKYTEVPKITKALMQKVFEIKEGNRTLQLAWICSALHDNGTGTVTLKFAPDLKPYLLELKGLFTSFPLECILKLTSKYAIRLYEILKANEFKQTVIIELDEIRNMFKLSETYKIYFNLKNKVIEQARKEIAEKTDIIFDYETITERKKVIALKFTIKPNPKNKKKLEPQKQLPPTPTETTPTNQNDIEVIKDEFRRLYKGELVDRFVKQMLEAKGLEHIQECLQTYKYYIKGQVKIGIQKDLLTRLPEGVSATQLRNFLHWYTRRFPYRKVLAKSGQRVDLEGNSAGEITPDQVQQAKDALAGRRKRTAPSTNTNNALPVDAPLTEDNTVPGKLEVTIKFNALPKE